MPEVYELDVRLRHIEPPIWRTVEVPGSATLEDVHYALQVAMGWTNSHLHQFEIAGRSIGMAGVADAPRSLEDEKRVRLSDVAQQGDRFVYEYDFGDDWTHDVQVVRVAKVSKAPRARCTAGARACPPEDCGGPHRYEHMLSVLADPSHDEHADLMEWLGDGFEPEAFALPASGRDLGREMAVLKELAERSASSGGALEDELGIRQEVIDGLLALSPRQRAGLASLLAASLASELQEVQSSYHKLVQQLQPPAKRRTTKRPTRRH